MCLEYKKSVYKDYVYMKEYNSLLGQNVLLTDCYTELLIIQRHRGQNEREKEICFRGEKFFSARDSEKYSNFTVEQFFSPDDHGLIPKAVVLQGNSGNGKSFTAQKIMLDWASSKLYADNFDFIFHLKCEDFNKISEEKSLVELLRYSQSLTPAQISQILQHSPERVLFLIDGFDELKLSQDNMSNLSLPTVQTPPSPESTLKALLSGRLQYKSSLLVTTRSTATDRLNELLKKQPQRFTEIMGFSERGVEEYFQRFFKDDQLLQTQAYELVKTNETLFTACSIPVICWIICTVFRERCKDGFDASSGLDTTTSIYVDFVSTLLEHRCQGLSQPVPSLLRSLGQLAERGMLEQQVLFDKKSVSETVSDPTNNPFLCKFLFKRKIRQETMFSFLHLSFQEFFTALYYALLNEEESQRIVRDLLQSLDSTQLEQQRNNKLYFLPVIQFLCGLSNEEVNISLVETHKLSVSPNIKAQLKEWIIFLQEGNMYLHRDMRMFILYCLYELHDEDFVKKAVEIWENIDLSGIPLRRTDCWVLQYCLQFCPHIKKLSFICCNITAEKLKILQPAVSKREELALMVENLSDDDIGVLVSAVGEGKNLSSLELQNSVMSDQGVQQVLCFLNKQKNVDEFYLTVKTITPNTAAMIIEFFQNEMILTDISVKVCGLGVKSFCSSLSVSVTDGDFRLSVEDYRGTDLDEQFDALMSFLNSVSGLKKVDLNVISLTESWAARILSLIQTCPSLQDISVEVCGLSNLNLCSSLRASVTDEDFRLDLEDASLTIFSEMDEYSSPQTEPLISEISLTCPRSETSNINWTKFTQTIYGVNISRENSPEYDRLDDLLSFLNSVPGLKKVDLNVIRLTESRAVKILSLIQTYLSLQDIRLSFGEDTRKSSEISSPQTEPLFPGISLTCPYSEISNISWATFTQIIHRLKDATEEWTDLDEQFNALLSFLSSVPGLKVVDLIVISLTESCAARILSLIQTCPSLQDISVEVCGLSNLNLCSSLRASVTDEDFRLDLGHDGWSRFSERGESSDESSVESSEISSPQTEPSLSGISFTCPYSEISNINWTTFTQIIHGIRDATEEYVL
ncbi:NACHT, LRR and PYD domains-containing protein 3-like [Chanos chanos]|uniref:NACHT, LRR and PYD domains-containing protein 3-like n=1 Tax=Chanos chanos TaxID=29144 RepID=A0A6J2VAI1_CHACN|nr:NACHT, LRR and PYD domains-containing protein 3-like [Chanos chanos]